MNTPQFSSDAYGKQAKEEMEVEINKGSSNNENYEGPRPTIKDSKDEEPKRD